MLLRDTLLFPAITVMIDRYRRYLSKDFMRQAWSAVFNLDYAFTSSFIRMCGVIGLIIYPAFHFSEQALGYKDWIPLRIACTLLCMGMIFWPRGERWRKPFLWYWEICLFILMPFDQVMVFLINPNDSYWASSNVFWALFLGFMTKSTWLPVHLFLGQGLAFLVARSLASPLPDAILHGLLAQQLSIWATACTGQCLKIAFEVFHRRGISLAGANARAQEAEAREAEIKAAYSELKRREEVIRRFVRPSLFEELAKGSDPTEFRPVHRDLAVMFCDIRDFTHLTEVLSAEEKQTFLNHYFSLMTAPILAHGGEVDKIMGDCVMGLFPDGKAAVAAALDMRLSLQDFNREMYAQGKPKIRNGIGIAKGRVMLGNFGSFEKLDRTVIGEAVNIAARLESKTKMYNLEVVVTEDIIRDLGDEGMHHRWIDLVQVKGSSRRLKLFEVYGHQPAAVRGYKDGTRGKMEKALALYFQKSFRDASRMFRAMLEEVPPHRHDADELMDRLLDYYIAHCEAWNDDAKGAWQRIESWEGVHVFYEK